MDILLKNTRKQNFRESQMYLRYVNFYFFEEILYRIFLGKITMSRFRFLHIEEFFDRRYRGNLQLIQRFLTLLSRFKLLKYLIFFEVFNYSQKNSFTSSFFIHIVKNYKRYYYEILKWTANVIGVCANFMYGIYKLRSVILITRLRNN